ncbi:7-carboxy-7-deazaguanine synthase QueE [Clavibacter michiganensis]|uniref:7-carboxy-7-deazaguanine synthase QueE n=1 Tax=Clavibacter michiganensis TaxID=28447 RepID=UPI0034639F21
MSTVEVSEVFTSIQGEGPSAGHPAVFLRLAHCNLACSWCDTPYSWDWSRYDRESESSHKDVFDIAGSLEADLCRTNLLIVTGGEPLLQQRNLLLLFDELRLRIPALRIEIETNGTIRPSRDLISHVSLFVVSPKLENSGLERRRRLRINTLSAFVDIDSAFKFVVSHASDIEEIDAIVVELSPREGRVWLMAEGVEAEQSLSQSAALAPLCIERGYRLSLRLHVLLWGDKRGT